MIGRQLAHYKITAKLGEGGMGVVYRAHDTRLDRDVALKVLPEAVAADAERLERFTREARMAAGLNHPNIVTLHSVEEADGVHFLTMELVDGKGLDQLIPAGGMELRRLFDLAIPIADAVAAAHEAGITHRDLKPANVMVARDGRAKVLDFGLARFEATGPAATEALTEALTEEGVVVGTVRYMSPEQARGEVVDARSDIFSLGAVLYEMATGRQPFAGASSAELLSSILRDDPPPVTAVKDELPHHLGRIIKRCLEKDPRRRYQAALDVRNELAGLRDELVSSPSLPEQPAVGRPAPGRRTVIVAAAVALAAAAGLLLWQRSHRADGEAAAARDAPRRTLVVLPFENLGAPEDAFFADGMTDELTSRLASIRDIGVIARSSAQRYAESKPSARQLAEELGVDYVIEGTVRWAHDAGGASRVRITPTLVQAKDATQLWSGIFDRELEDVFQIQAEIASQVLEELGLTLGGEERAAVEERPTANLEAYEAYLKGQEYWQIPGYDQESFELAATLFERAAELDPQFLQPIVTLVSVNGTLYFSSGEAGQLEAMREALRRAEALAPDSPYVEAARGVWHYFGEKDYAAAYARFARAAEALPNDPEPVQMMALIRRRQGRLDDAVAYFRRVLEMSPRDAHTSFELSRTLEAAHRFAESEEAIVRAQILAPDRDNMYGSHAMLLLRWKGDLEAARAVAAAAPPPRDETSWTALRELEWYQRDWEEVTRRAEARLAASPNDWDRLDDLLILAEVHSRRGESARLEPLLAEALPLARRMAAASPSSVRLQFMHAEAETLGGHPDLALAAVDRAAEAIGPDLFTAPGLDELRAWIYAHAGDTNRALDLLEEVVRLHFDRPLTPALLRVDPWWDLLRDEPRFQRLIAEG